jgi:hypothetical protein
MSGPYWQDTYNRDVEIRKLKSKLARATRSLEVNRLLLTMERRRVSAIRMRIDDAIETIEHAETLRLIPAPGFLCSKLRSAKTWDPEEATGCCGRM